MTGQEAKKQLKTRTVFPFGIDDIIEDQFQCPLCKEWTRDEEAYEALDNKIYCWECGKEVDEELRSKWADDVEESV